MATAVESPDPSLRFQVFGGLRLWCAGVEVRLGPPHHRVILAALLAARGQVVSMAGLIDLVWGEDPPSYAANQIHRHIGELRRLLQPALPVRQPGRWLLAGLGGYRLNVGDAQCDLTLFQDLLLRARTGAPVEALDCLVAALEVAQQAPFIGLPEPVRARPEFVAVEQQRISAARDALELALVVGAADRVVDLARPMASSALFDEALQARLIRALMAGGRPAEALVCFEETRRRLADELGVDPSAELRAAHRDLLAADQESTSPVRPDPATPRPAQLPPRIAGFTERGGVAGELDEQFAAAAAGQAVVITALGGMGGVGKTALAVHWAHEVKGHYPDGQLYLNLRGFDPGGRVVEPMAAVTMLLESLDVSLGDREADSLDARAALFRSVVAGRRILLVLDNARDSDQVRPLLPGAAGCLVIVTSRNRLSGLVVREGARLIVLDRLNDEESRQLLANRLGAARAASSPAAVDQILAACAGLPLALAIAAARAVTNPGLTLADVAAELVAAGQLDTLSTGEAVSDLRSVFAWSYDTLSPGAARVFRVLAAHPGPEISLPSAASMTGLEPSAVRGFLRELTAASMLTEPVAGRFVLHDLIRVYAGELLRAAGERGDAELRLVEHYQHSTRNAFLRYGRAAIDELEPPDRSFAVETFDSLAATTSWYLRERAVLIAVVHLAVEHGMDRAAVRIVLDWRPMNQAVDSARDTYPQALAGLLAAERLGDVTLLAEMERDMGVKHYSMSQFDDAAGHLGRALSLFQQNGDLFGEANTLRNMGQSAVRAGDLVAASGYMRRAVVAAERSGDQRMVVIATVLEAQVFNARKLWAESFELAERALPIARAQQMHYDAITITELLAEHLVRFGRFAEAIELAVPAIEARFVHEPKNAFAILGVLAEAYVGVGDFERARAVCERYAQTLALHGAEYRSAALYAGQAAENDQQIAKVLAILRARDARSGRPAGALEL